MRLSPEATYDVLYIADRLREESGMFTVPEMHLFSYLACLLWLYQGRTVTDWGYHFVGTELGAPFSVDLDQAVTMLIERGFIVRVQEHLRISELAEQPLRDLGELALVKERIECLNAACASTAAFSAGVIGNALAQEPDLKRAQLVPMSRPLLEESARSQLYAQFDALRRGLKQEGDDLRVPAVVWLAALYRSSDITA
jgi:hypothetical protein